MSNKFIVVQGASCKCQFGTTPDKIKVLSHAKEYANDKDGTKKAIVTTKETGGATFEKNTFGSCAKTNNKPCQPNITEWKDFYKEVTLSNGGNMILDDSKAVCAIAGTPCIEITDHGQITEAGAQNFKNVNPEIHNQLNPLVDLRDMAKESKTHRGVEFKTQ